MSNQQGNQNENEETSGPEIEAIQAQQNRNQLYEKVNNFLDKQDREMEEAQANPHGIAYGIRTGSTAKVVYELTDSNEIMEDIRNSKSDYLVPIFREAKKIEPARCPLVEVPLGRYSPFTGRVYNDHTLKNVYVQNNDGYQQIGKEMSYSQPILSHEWVEDVLYIIRDKYADEFEIYDTENIRGDKKGYRHFWGILSKRIQYTVENSFRSDDTIRVGAVVRNGIDEGTAIGFDMFTFAVRCANGSIGRGKELGSQAWVHAGNKERLEEAVLEGLQGAFKIGQQFFEYIEASNKIQMTNAMLRRIYDNTGIREKYYDPDYFIIQKNAKPEDPGKVQLQQRSKPVSLWEGYNAFTREIWHETGMGFGDKSKQLRQLNVELVKIVKANAASQ